MFEIILGGSVGFILFMLATHPGSKVNRRLPEKKIKNLQIFPRFNVSAKNRVYHVHHWMFLTPILLVVQSLFQSNIIHGFFIGGILQGLMFKDRFRFIFKNDEYHMQIKNSSVHVPLIKRLRKLIK